LELKWLSFTDTEFGLEKEGTVLTYNVAMEVLKKERNFSFRKANNFSIAIVSQERLSHRARMNLIRKSYGWLHANKIKAFYTLVDDIKFEVGARALLQASGLGKLKPNILMMGYKSDWRTCNAEDLEEYFTVLQ
jgi:solute carrier family 12 sodium/potassium/chloride transporter 2